MCRCFIPWCLQARPYCQSELGSTARALWQRQVHDQADEPSPYTNVIKTVASWNSERTFIHITSTICSPMWKSDIAWHKALIPSNPWGITKDMLENNQLDRSISWGYLRIYEDTWGYIYIWGVFGQAPGPNFHEINMPLVGAWPGLVSHTPTASLCCCGDMFCLSPPDMFFLIRQILCILPFWGNSAGLTHGTPKCRCCWKHTCITIWAIG